MMDIPEDNPVGDTSADTEEVKTKARERNAKEREARRFYNSVFREVPFWLKAAYRGPLLLLVVLIALVVSIFVPLAFGFVLYTLMAVALGDIEASAPKVAFALWFMGLVVVGGAGATGLALFAFWDATLDAIKRTFGLLRGE